MPVAGAGFQRLGRSTSRVPRAIREFGVRPQRRAVPHFPEVLAGPQFLLQDQGRLPVLEAAGVGAGPPVGRAAGDVVREQALAGQGQAHGTVGENLQFHAGTGRSRSLGRVPVQFPGHGPDVPAGQLPGQVHPRRAHPGPGPHGLGVHGVGLGAGVQGKIGEDAPGEPGHPQVGHDDPVQGQPGQIVQPGLGPGQLPGAGQHVQTVVQPHPARPGQDRSLLQLLPGKAEAAARRLRSWPPR